MLIPVLLLAWAIIGTCYCLMDLDEEWENSTIESHMCYNGVEEVCMNFVLFCKFGEEMIYPIVSGQCRTMEEALYHVELYLEGEISEEEIEEYIEFVALESDMELPMITRGKLVGRGVTYDFDNYIVAWTYYWNQKIINGSFRNDTLIRPEVVKAMIMGESSWGAEGGNNSSIDVMQCFNLRDYGIWILSGINPENCKVWKEDGNELLCRSGKDGYIYGGCRIWGWIRHSKRTDSYTN